MITCCTCSGATSALSSAALIAVPPSSVASILASPPPSLPLGLRARARFDAERARSAAAVAHGRALELGADTLCWEVPHHVGDEIVAGLVEGTLLHAYRFDRYMANDDRGALEKLLVSAHHDVA